MNLAINSQKFHIPFVKYRSPLMAASTVLMVLAIIGISVRGFNYGIDFKGGAKLEYQFANAVTENEVRNALAGLQMGEVSVVRFGEAREHRMSIKVALPEQHAKIAPPITAALEQTFGAGNVQLEREETVGPKVGQEMRKKAMLTILFSWVLMLIYIAYRFDFEYAPGAVASLVHDTLIVLGVFAWMGKEINLTILAALLTLIGFSINDTIVVFDRIRENRSRMPNMDVLENVNNSLNATLSRTIITSLTVFFVVLVLFFFGGGTLHDFAFAMIVGVLIGTYSSLFVATPIYIWMQQHWPKLRAKM